jgi:hypothetical protein
VQEPAQCKFPAGAHRKLAAILAHSVHAKHLGARLDAGEPGFAYLLPEAPTRSTLLAGLPLFALVVDTALKVDSVKVGETLAFQPRSTRATLRAHLVLPLAHTIVAGGTSREACGARIETPPVARRPVVCAPNAELPPVGGELLEVEFADERLSLAVCLRTDDPAWSGAAGLAAPGAAAAATAAVFGFGWVSCGGRDSDGGQEHEGGLQASHGAAEGLALSAAAR